MCRLFGFRSVIKSKVHRSLISADNALMNQGEDHPDGWGVAYWIAGAPNIVRSLSSAMDDKLFQKVSGLVASETVVAHLRKATSGSLSVLNTHPFQYGKWVFAHNGNIKDLSKHRKHLLAMVSPELQRFVLGETDSELIFYALLTELAKATDIHSDVDFEVLAQSIRVTVNKFEAIVGPCFKDDLGPASETYLTFLISNGDTMAAFQGGKHLYYSTYKTKCAERDVCPSFSEECESASDSGNIKHLLFSSEPLSGENVWNAIEYGRIVGSDKDMKFWMI